MSAVAILSLSACSKGNGSAVLPDGKYGETDFPGKSYSDRDYIALKNLLIHIRPGESQKIDFETFPGSYGASQLEFISKDTSIATVDASGNVTGVKAGLADIEVNSKDGTFSNKIRVAVSTASSEEELGEFIADRNAYYNDESYQDAMKVKRYEYSEECYFCEGVLDHGMKGYEILTYDRSEGYFCYEGPSVYYKTPYGDPEVKDGTWIFYPINQGIKTRLIHINPTSKNYFDINTAAYSGDYHAIIKDILNFFFVSGEKILTNLIDDFSGKVDFLDFQGYQATKYYEVDDDSISISYHQEGESTITAEYEINYVDIPADTVTRQVLDIDFVNSNYRSRAMNYDARMYYERDGKDWERRFIKNDLYEDEFEIQKIQNPKDNGFQYVDSLYDL